MLRRTKTNHPGATQSATEQVSITQTAVGKDDSEKDYISLLVTYFGWAAIAAWLQGSSKARDRGLERRDRFRVHDEDCLPVRA